MADRTSTLRRLIRRPWRLLLRSCNSVNAGLTRLRFVARPIQVGSDTWISWRSVVRAGVGGRIRIGDRCEIDPYAMLLGYGGEISLGNDCSLNPFVILYGHGGLHVGNGVRIAAHVVIIPANHNPSTSDVPLRDSGLTTKGIRIDDEVWIGAGARILDGVRIGRGAIVGAGAVVTQSVDAGCTVAGVPARVVRRRS
jgi:acetyltransferase-like isoleucine patch superfamily enzyme